MATTSTVLTILSQTGGIAGTNCYVIADEQAREAVLFDAPDHTVSPVLDEVTKRGWKLIGLWLTHGHFDHFADHQVVRSRFPAAQILLHSLEVPKTRSPILQVRGFQLPFEIPALEPDVQVYDNQQLKLGGFDVRVLHTPGHAPGHVAYYFPNEGILVGGDLIIGGGVGRTDLPDSKHEDLEASVRRVMQLPDATKLLGGHGAVTTLGEERKHNALVREILGLS